MLEDEAFLLAGLEACGLDFADLVPEEVALPLRLGGVGDEGRKLVPEGIAAPDGVREGLADGTEATEGVEDGQLLGGLEEGLVVVRPVEIDEPFADRGQGGEGRGRPVDELAVDPGRRHGAANDEHAALAWVDAGVGEETVHGVLESVAHEDGLDGEEVGARADGASVGTLADGQLDGAEDDGLARAGFAGDDIEPRVQVEDEVGHQGEVAYS